ncbi:MAG: glycosyltransferase family 4 protein [Bacteriovoracaceae bacterium]|nr:glycosyltransferase family 4 protein [Bacteriovoracaceae bacterium]
MKLALVKKKDSSFWRSCQSITSNLEQAYTNSCEREGHEVETLVYSSQAGHLESHDLGKRILEGEFDLVVWLDHYPHPYGLIKFLLNNCAKNECPPFVIHLFGDFILHAPMWGGVEEEIRKTGNKLKLHFVAASHKQRDLVKSLLKSATDENVSVMAFPVNETSFFFSSEIRQTYRKKYNFKDGETIFYYSGRLSYQKNIIDLIYTFSAYSKNFDSKAKLILSGPMDDLGIPYLGKEALDGTFFFHWEECLRDLFGLVEAGKIVYLGNLSQEDLLGTYCASDVFTSLSCHNDEDYGMAPAEALSCGLPCVLTDWGGYSSFKSYSPSFIGLVPVEPGEQRHKPQKAMAVKAMATLSMGTDRRALSKNSHNNLGITEISKQIESLCKREITEFSGFNEKFFKLCSLFENNPRAPFRGPGGNYSLFYKDLYHPYWTAYKEVFENE